MNKMCKRSVLSHVVVVVLLGLSMLPSTQAQPPHHGPENAEMRERMDRMFVAYLSEELELSEAQGHQFWPMHEAFSVVLKATEERVHMARRGLANAGEDGMADFGLKLDELLASETELANRRAAFLREVALVFGPTLAVKFVGARKRFEHDMRERMGERLSGPHRGGKRKPNGDLQEDRR